jgi:hypothetical protein
METYTQLGLRNFPRSVARQAKKAAAQRDMTLTQFIAFAVTETVKNSGAASHYGVELARDLEWYERHRAELVKVYPPGEHLAIVAEQVVDHDADASKLAVRLREKYGRRSILMPRADAATRPVVHLRSPRRVR